MAKLQIPPYAETPNMHSNDKTILCFKKKKVKNSWMFMTLSICMQIKEKKSYHENVFEYAMPACVALQRAMHSEQIYFLDFYCTKQFKQKLLYTLE